MARTTKKTKRGFVETLDKHSLAIKIIASIIRLDGLYILLDKNGRTISYTKLNPDDDGKTPSDADELTKTIVDGSNTVPLLNLGNGNYVRCSSIEAIENHSGSDLKGLIFRSEGDAILAFLSIRKAEVRDLAVSKFHAALESFESGQFVQPDLAGFFNHQYKD
jgi:hypothetical protein